MPYCSKNVCWRWDTLVSVPKCPWDTSALVPNCGDISAPVWWCRNVLGPKYLSTLNVVSGVLGPSSMRSPHARAGLLGRWRHVQITQMHTWREGLVSPDEAQMGSAVASHLNILCSSKLHQRIRPTSKSWTCLCRFTRYINTVVFLR